MTAASVVMLLVVSADALTGSWRGARDELQDFGVNLDLTLTSEGWYVTGQQSGATGLLHMDLALTLDTAKLGLWPGGKLYVLGQASAGDEVNDLVGSANEISNLEARRFTQVAEAFYEQSLFGEKVRLRLGKQDANRDYGTPRYSGNFINNNFGMYPTAPLPSYPTTGLGATLNVDPLWWLSVRASLYQGDPQVGHFDFTLDEGALGIVGVAVKHLFLGRHGGTTSGGAWAHTDGRWGVMFQNDERIYSHPDDPEDGRGLNVITRVSASKGTDVPLYAGASLAWHGLWARDNDTVGLGFGYFTHATGGGELFFELFYKARFLKFFSVQPDVQLYRINSDVSVLFGLRLKLKV